MYKVIWAEYTDMFGDIITKEATFSSFVRALRYKKSIHWSAVEPILVKGYD